MEPVLKTKKVWLAGMVKIKIKAQISEMPNPFWPDSWENINAEFISFESWDDGLLTRLVGKSKATHEIIFSEMPRAQ